VAIGFPKDTNVKCVVCKQGNTGLGTATVTLDRDNLTTVVKGVPAQVCSNCGEEYVDEGVAAELLRLAEDEASAGTQVDVREYRAA
jgi:YgiT-type zinc finger domain-containing protein